MEKLNINEQTRILLNSIPVAVHIWNRDGKIIDCNNIPLKKFKLNDKQEYIDRFYDYSPEYQPDGQLSAEKCVTLIKKIFDDGKSFVFEWMNQMLDGAPMPMEITCVRVKFEDDYVAVSYSRDLREHKKMMKEIEQHTDELVFQSHWYKSILDATPFPITVTDSNMNWTFVNKAVEDFLGTKLEDMLGKPCSNWNANICNTSDCGIACAKRGLKRTFFAYNGATYQVDVEILKKLDGAVAGFIEVVQDITKLKEMEKEALSASKAKSQFLSSMSHEMRTPMNAIIGMAAIGLNAADIQGKNNALKKIEDASMHLLGVINDVLDMSKIEANKLELSHIDFDLKHTLQKAVSLLQFIMEEKQIHFFMNIDDNVPFFFTGDDQRLTQVLTNLLSNALKFTPKEGRISLDVSMTGEDNGICELRFKVADTGIGIAAEQQEKIFHAFEQAENGTTRKFGGTGLGLVIVKRIVELMGGKIWVESELGKGAQFIFTVKLPRKEKTSSVQDAASENGKYSVRDIYEKFKGKKLLIVEDIEINREILLSLLNDTGLIIDIAENGKEAVDMVTAASGNYDLIFMDMQMPVMDGIEATRQIRALPLVAERKLPIIAMTANVFQEDIENCYAAGMDDHIGKPLEMAKVLEKLNEYLAS